MSVSEMGSLSIFNLLSIMKAIKTLDKNVSGFKNHTDPEVVKWFSELK